MATQTALIVDDEPDIRQLLGITLSQLGIEVVEAPDIKAAYQKLLNATYDLCLTDMRLPDGDGLQLIDHIQEKYPDLPVAMITAYGNTDVAVEALKRGAFDFVSKPVQLGKLRALVKTALQLSTSQNTPPAQQISLIGSSELADNLRDQIARVARSEAPVYVSGESGSGKEIVARTIHYQGPRSQGPFIPVNCGAIPSELMESEFFGHKKGSFTGAHQDKQGLFQAANGGTLFLDEVADLPLDMQVKLLRGIQEKSVRPVGADTEILVDVRILSASHKDLSQEVKLGHFRQDLYYRINVIEINVPPLRDRPEDIVSLIEFFMKRNTIIDGDIAPHIEPETMSALLNHDFPGNVRELENTLERARTLCDGKTIKVEDLQLKSLNPGSINDRPEGEHQDQISSETVPSFTGGNLDDYLAGVEKRILEEALEEARWNKTQTAENLGLSFRQLRYKLKKLEIN
jgi:two-component system response regulator PilR (NtrC family)